MGMVKRFEDLNCWQAARDLVKLVYLACLESPLKNDFETRGQVKKAALSSMNNIAEGFGRISRKEFIRFLEISQSSAMEVRSITYVLEDLNYLPEEKNLKIRNAAESVKRQTLGLVKYLTSRSR